MYQIQQIHSTNENVYNTDNVYTYWEMKKKQQQEKSAQKKHTN